jgi:ATP-binding cassette subfamily C protein CydCD
MTNRMRRPVTAGDSPVAGFTMLGWPMVYLLGIASAGKALALVGMASALALGIVSLVDGDDAWRSAVILGIGATVLRAAATWAQRAIAAHALLGTKERLRAELAESLASRGPRDVGEQTTLATLGLDELDDYITVFLPALVNAAVLPLLIGARILFADWVSALIIVLTVPLIPVFMTLIGLHTRDRVAEASTALSRLSNHLVELSRGIAVLIGLGRAREQVRALREISEAFRVSTLRTLRTAFLSSLALELIATISVAIVAVFIGFRLVGGSLPLELGLLALLLAPECFTPFREVGSAFHASQDGREALSRARTIIDAPPDAPIVTIGDTVGASRLGIRYRDREQFAVRDLSFIAPAGLVTVLDGASGSGKSTVLRLLAGRLTRHQLRDVEGAVTSTRAARVAWLPQHPRCSAETVQAELELYGSGTDAGQADLRRLLDRLGLAHLAAAAPTQLSPGELRRLAFGRVLLRVEAGASLVLLDEPTAHLDERSARCIRDLIADLRGRTTVIVASHDPAVRDLGDVLVPMVPSQGASVSSGGQHAARPLPEPAAQPDSGASPRQGIPRAAQGSTLHVAARELARFLRPVGGRMTLALALGTLASIFAIGLTGVSAWLIVRASEQPAIFTLLVAIVGVRFFGIGRAVLRYAERLVAHDAVFGALTSLRMRLWNGLAERGVANRSLLSSATTLDRIVRDADIVRDLALRAVLPPLIGVVTLIVTVVGLLLVAPEAFPVLAGLAAMALLVAPCLALLADRSAARTEHGLRSTVLRRFAALLEAADDLGANGVDGVARAELSAADATAGRTARRGALALGLGEALVIAACGAASVLMLTIAVDPVAAGTLDHAIVAVLVLTPLGLIEPLLAALAGVRMWPVLSTVLARVASLATPSLPETLDAGPTRRDPRGARVDRIILDRITVRWAGANHPVFAPVEASVARGEWLIVTGPSGAGKSTLLAMMLGHVAPDAGHFLVDGTDVAGGGERPAMAWCPQEAHLFDSTLRANLLLSRRRDDAPDDAEMIAALRRVGLGTLLASLPRGLDTRIGSQGAALSGGQRQRLAVARTLLTHAPIVLVDEPTAHLDEPGAIDLMVDLRVALADRIAVLVTHSTIGVEDRDTVIRLTPFPAVVPVEVAPAPSVNVGAPA